MRALKMYFLLLPVFTLFFTSCSKDESVENPASQEVATLSLEPVLKSMMNRAQSKQAMTDLPDCADAVPAYAQLSLTYGDSNVPVDVTVDILSDDNGFFTAYADELEIPVPAGSSSVSVTITDFVVWDNGSPGEIIWAAPKSGSEYAGFVDQPLPISWDLRAGSKTYLEIPVICFDDRQVNLYGYLFFDLMPTEASTLCFFANYCTDGGRHYTANYSLDLYLGTSDAGTPLYMDQTPATGMQEDFYANPVCLAVPAPAEGIGDDEAYLYYEITLLDWEGNYGSAGDYVQSGTLSWNEVQALLNDDGLTAEYKHIRINCPEVDNGRDTNILLTVDTQNINENNLNATVFFNDDRTNTSDPSGNLGDPDEFISVVDRNRRVFWRGKTLNENSSISIDIMEIFRKSDGGAEILESTEKVDTLIVGQVRDEDVSGFENYGIIFRIIDGEDIRTFTIDPKLKMSSTN